MSKPLAFGALALFFLGTRASAQSEAHAPPMLYYWTQPFAEGGEDDARGLLRRMEEHLTANYPGALGRRIFTSPFAGRPTMHSFARFESAAARLRFEREIGGDEDWLSLQNEIERAFGVGAERVFLFPLGGAGAEDPLLPYRRLRVATAHPSRRHEARLLAAELVDYLEGSYEEVDARAYSADLHRPEAIYMVVDYANLGSWERVRARLLKDEHYGELLMRAEELFLDNTLVEVMLLESWLDSLAGANDYYQLATDRKGRGDLRGAIAAYHIALEIEPDLGAAVHDLGHALMDIGEPAEAAVAFRRWSELEPSRVKAYTDLGRALGRSGDFEGAVASLRTALELQPTSHDAHASIGWWLMERGDQDEAAAHCEKAIELRPDHGRGYVNLGVVYRERGDLDAAARHFLKAIEVQPDYARGHTELIELRIAQGDYEAAIGSLRAAAVADPSSVEIHNSLAWMLATCEHAELRDAPEALRFAQRAMALAPGDASCIGTYGAVLYRSGQLVEADRALRRAIELSERGYPEDGFFLVMVHHDLGNRDEARRWYELSVEWMSAGAEQGDVVSRLRAEAAAKLGLGE